MSFKAMLLKDAAVTTDPCTFGERVTYVKRDGSRRLINAVVNRTGIAPLGSLETKSPACTIYVANDATTGISSVEIDRTDRVELDLKKNGEAVSLAVVRSDDGGRWAIDDGMLRLGLR